MRRAAISAGLLLLAIVIQLTVLNGLPLPGSGEPDLVLVVVTAVALCGGPVEGMLGGFAAGLALDIAPPATHLIGQDALVFCVVGYVCGLLGTDPDQTALVPITVAAIGSAAGELLYAVTGMMFGDPDITWSAVQHVLPSCVLYDILLSPFVLYGVVQARGLALDGPGAAAPVPSASLAAGAGLLAGVASGAGTVLRDTGSSGGPRLTARALRGSTPGTQPVKRPGKRAVDLRLRASGMQGGSASGIRAATPRTLQGRPVDLRLGRRRGDGVVASSLRGLADGIPGIGAEGSPLRPSRGPRLRAGAMRGGSSSGLRSPASRPALRSPSLRLGSGRRKDGAIGGSLLGSGGGTPRMSLRSGGRRRSVFGKTRAPRFRASKVSGSSLLGKRRGRAMFGRSAAWRGRRRGGLG